MILIALAKEPASFLTVNIRMELDNGVGLVFTLESTAKRVVFSPLLFILEAKTFNP